jgi:hypothetical protein
MIPPLTQDALFHNFHPPEEVRVFTAPLGSVKLWTPSAVVFDVRIGDAILRNYHFADRWFEVHCTFDLNGEPLAEPGPIDWAFNCDMVTPFVMRDNKVYNVDLALDVMVAPDGLNYLLTDEDDFAEDQAAGLFTRTEVIGARQGANELISIISSTGLRPFLEGILPFDSVFENQPQGPPGILSVEQVPLFSLAERERVWPPALLASREAST